MVQVIGMSRASTVTLLLVVAIVFGALCEFFLPFLIAHREPERVLEILLPSFRVFSRPLEPLTLGLTRLLNRAKRERSPASLDEASENGTAATMSSEVSQDPAVAQQEERRLLQSIVDFGDTLVREVMTPRPDIVAVRSDATLEELRAVFREQEYSRIPAYQDSLDNILGFVFVKDLILLDETPRDHRLLPELLRPAHFVPETKRVSELLKEFQRQQVQSAIVVDEYGGTAGLVTLEDLLEEIVGEIRDEYDVESEPIVDEGNGSFVFSGKFEVDGLKVQVVEAERRRIHKVRISRPEPIAEQVGNA
jgi:CBS domain containing-hemolysin-like protein